MEYPSKPFFNTPYKGSQGGVDYLGIRQVNLNLMALFLPGINNVTYYIRPYSVMTWMAWAFKNKAREEGMYEIKKSEYEQFRQKVEILFGWGHKLDDNDKGLVGNTQKEPINKANVPLTFKAWKRNVSWLDAVNYGPSLKTANGLGFIYPIKQSIFAPTSLGVELAEALDNRLKKCGGYRKLTSLKSTTGNVALARSLHKAWSINTVSAKEAVVFRKALFAPDKITEQTELGRRSASIKLILSALKSINRPATDDDVRKFMTYNLFPFKKIKDYPEPVAQMNAIWRVLQIRQLQRLSLEKIFGWMELQIIDEGFTSSTEIASSLMKNLKSYEPDTFGDSWVEDVLTEYEKSQLTFGSLISSKAKNTDLDIFNYMNQIKDNNTENANAEIISLRALVLCAIIALELLKDKRAKQYVMDGGSIRISLNHWANFVYDNKSLSLKYFLIKFIDNYLLSQHFGVAAVRYSEGKQRLRLTIEDRGLVSLLASRKKAWSPNITSDRLDHILSLMSECRLITSKMIDNQRHYVTR